MYYWALHVMHMNVSVCKELTLPYREKLCFIFIYVFVFQPNPSNKLAIIHILGLLSNLFTTLDISKQDNDSADGSAPPVKSSPPLPGPNPVSPKELLCLIQEASSS